MIRSPGAEQWDSCSTFHSPASWRFSRTGTDLSKSKLFKAYVTIILSWPGLSMCTMLYGVKYFRDHVYEYVFDRFVSKGKEEDWSLTVEFQ